MKKHSSTFLKLKEISFNAYAPYSQLRVSTLIKFHNGQEVCGVNFENKSYGATICAERCAIGNALTLGCDLKTACGIYLYASRSEWTWPCGICRQVMVETCLPEIKVITFNSLGNKKIATLASLLPNWF